MGRAIKSPHISSPTNFTVHPSPEWTMWDFYKNTRLGGNKGRRFDEIVRRNCFMGGKRLARWVSSLPRGVWFVDDPSEREGSPPFISFISS